MEEIRKGKNGNRTDKWRFWIALTDFDDEDEVRRKVMDGIWDRRCLFGRRSPRAGP
jgi:hypothetical protein